MMLLNKSTDLICYYIIIIQSKLSGRIFIKPYWSLRLAISIVFDHTKIALKPFARDWERMVSMIVQMEN